MPPGLSAGPPGWIGPPGPKAGLPPALAARGPFDCADAAPAPPELYGPFPPPHSRCWRSAGPSPRPAWPGLTPLRWVPPGRVGQGRGGSGTRTRDRAGPLPAAGLKFPPAHPKRPDFSRCSPLEPLVPSAGPHHSVSGHSPSLHGPDGILPAGCLIPPDAGSVPGPGSAAPAAAPAGLLPLPGPPAPAARVPAPFPAAAARSPAPPARCSVVGCSGFEP